MSPAILFTFVIGYFLILLGVSWYTSRGSNNESFFIGNKKSNWMLVAFGMIGTSLSGVTFVSVPGGVGKIDDSGIYSGNFFYFQLVIGYLLGYLVIAFVLLPLYYKLNLTSIYTYLNKRFGSQAHKTGAYFFMLSRTIGATARLYLVINILQLFILDKMGVPFIVTAFVILLMILLYTLEGGVKTIIYTDTLQTSGMLIGLMVCIFVIIQTLGTDFSGALQLLYDKGYTTVFNSKVDDSSFFLKHIIGGMFITIAMTGLDQEMMQKNISVNNLKDAQKNMMSFTAVLMFVNFLFLMLGGLLYLYAEKNGLKVKPDDLFPTVALNAAFGTSIGIIFILALISALFPSVDGAITSLTSCYCIDILNLQESSADEQVKKRKRMFVHLSFALLFFLLVLIFKFINDKNIIDFIMKIAGITYGPLLGLFAFGILTRRVLRQQSIRYVCVVAPLLALGIDLLSNPKWYEDKLHIKFGLNEISAVLFHGYKIGYELILINGILTFIGLFLISRINNANHSSTS